MEEVLDNKTSSKSTAKKVKDKTINDGVQKIKGNQNGKKLPPTPKAIIPNPDPAIDMIKKDLSGDKK